MNNTDKDIIAHLDNVGPYTIDELVLPFGCGKFGVCREASPEVVARVVREMPGRFTYEQAFDFCDYHSCDGYDDIDVMLEALLEKTKCTAEQRDELLVAFGTEKMTDPIYAREEVESRRRQEAVASAGGSGKSGKAGKAGASGSGKAGKLSFFDMLAVAGGALIAGDPEASADIAQSTGISPANAGLAASLGGVVIMISAGLEVLMGILGLGAAKDNQRIMPVWVLALISLIMSVVSVITNVMSGVEASQMFSLITGLVIPALFFWFANTVKKEAGK